MTALFEEHASDVIGNDYLVLGTVERKAWREGMKQSKSIPEMLEHLHDFKEVRTVEAVLQAFLNAVPCTRIKGKFARPEAAALESLRAAFFEELEAPEAEAARPEQMRLM